MTPIWQYIMGAAQLVMNLTGIIILLAIARSIGAWEEWRKSATKQLDALGKMVQEQGLKVAELWGRIFTK